MDPLFWRVGPIIELKRPSLSIEPQVHVRKLKPRDLFGSISAMMPLCKSSSRTKEMGIENRLVRAALKEATKKREVSVHDLKMIRRHFDDDINIVVVCLQRHPGRCQIKAVEQQLHQ